jgi:hypothetical protein
LLIVQDGYGATAYFIVMQTGEYNRETRKYFPGLQLVANAGHCKFR